MSVVVEALAREVGAVGAALRKLSRASWGAPTRCEPWTVRELVAHMARGAVRIREMIAADAIDDEPEKDGVTYFQVDLEAEAPAIAARAADYAEEIGDGPAVVAFWDEQWSRALRAARASRPESVHPTPFGTMRIEEYVRTRVLEVTVHHMDMDEAIGHAAHPDARALAITADVLRGLLGTDLRPIGMDDVRFVLTGTGRAALTDEETSYLGPLATRFPLIR
ncbi:MAG TPA: maleylpyruvate isomerase family mycothiol-dependent enzyme [Actinomycetota bacterium]